MFRVLMYLLIFIACTIYKINIFYAKHLIFMHKRLKDFQSSSKNVDFPRLFDFYRPTFLYSH